MTFVKCMRYAFVLLTLLVAGLPVRAQDPIEIPKRFNHVEYYPDSTIKAIYQMRHGQPQGDAVEYDSTGTATAIGKFKRGAKHGVWIYRDAQSIEYKRGQREYGGYPGCGTGFRLARHRFQERYAELMSR